MRVLLVNDQAAYREGLRAMLSVVPDVEVVGEAEDGVEAVVMASELRPDVVLMDLHMPRLDGASATRRIRERDARCRVIALTTFADDDLVLDAVRAGAAG